MYAHIHMHISFMRVYMCACVGRHFDNSLKIKGNTWQNQGRFWCKERELTEWRNTLLYVYLAIEDSKIHLQITDYDQNDQVPLLPELKWIAEPTEDLAQKTTIRLFIQDLKRVTSTFYCKTKTDLALLCQGKDKLSCDRKECELLKHFVTAFLEDEDSLSLQEKLLHNPVTFVTSHGTLPQRASLMEGLDIAPNPTTMRQKVTPAVTIHHLMWPRQRLPRSTTPLFCCHANALLQSSFSPLPLPRATEGFSLHPQNTQRNPKKDTLLRS